MTKKTATRRSKTSIAKAPREREADHALRVEVLTGAFGTAVPRIHFRAWKEAQPRAFNAQLLRLAAEVEELSVGRAWSVQTSHRTDTEGYLALELAEGDANEVLAAVELLLEIVGSKRLVAYSARLTNRSLIACPTPAQNRAEAERLIGAFEADAQ